MMDADEQPFLIHASSELGVSEYLSSPNQSQSRQSAETKVEENKVILNSTDGKGGNTRLSLRRRYQRRQDVNQGETIKDDLNATSKMVEGEEATDPGSNPSKHLFERKYTSITTQPTVTEGRNLLRSSLPTVHHSNYIRKLPDEKLKEKFKNRLCCVADDIPEVHFIGEIIEGVGFKDSFISCKWYFEWGKFWSFLEGEDSSQTQYASSDDGVQVWNHPIDVHFASASIQGWPRMILQVWELDEYGRSIISGYGFVHLPTNAGYHELEVSCWRPSGSIREELHSFFLGTSSCLLDDEVIFGKAWEKRSQLLTISSGLVKLSVTVILKLFEPQGVR